MPKKSLHNASRIKLVKDTVSNESNHHVLNSINHVDSVNDNTSCNSQDVGRSAFKTEIKNVSDHVEKMYIHIYTTCEKKNSSITNIYWFITDTPDVNLLNDIRTVLSEGKNNGQYTRVTCDIMEDISDDQIFDALTLVNAIEYNRYCSVTNTLSYTCQHYRMDSSLHDELFSILIQTGIIYETFTAETDVSPPNNSKNSYSCPLCKTSSDQTNCLICSDNALLPIAGRDSMPAYIRKNLIPKSSTDPIISEPTTVGYVILFGITHILPWFTPLQLTCTIVPTYLQQHVFSKWYTTMCKKDDFNTIQNTCETLIKRNQITTNEEDSKEITNEVAKDENPELLVKNNNPLTHMLDDEGIQLFLKLYTRISSTAPGVLLSELYTHYSDVMTTAKFTPLPFHSFTRMIRSLPEYVIKRKSKGIVVSNITCSYKSNEYRGNISLFYKTQHIREMVHDNHIIAEQIGLPYTREALILLNSCNLPTSYGLVRIFLSNYTENELEELKKRIDTVLSTYDRGYLSLVPSIFTYPFSNSTQKLSTDKIPYTMNIGCVDVVEELQAANEVESSSYGFF